MLRRKFLALAPVIATAVPARAGSRTPQIIELRTYSFSSPEKQQAFNEFLARVAVPAWNRAGVRPVGLFHMLAADNAERGDADALNTYVLLPHASWNTFASLEPRLAKDTRYQQEGASILGAPKADPAFVRRDSQVFVAFSGRPRIMTPKVAEPSTRLFELRSYESHNDERAANKIAMFEDGEFPIFDRAHMGAVFYGRAVAGAGLPRLAYMIVHARQEDVKSNWKAFFQDAEWKRLVADPKYQDNVSKVVATFLRPIDGSQI